MIKQKDLNRKHYIWTAILLLLVITNPGRASFSSYLHNSSNSGSGREFNFFVASIYSNVYYYNPDKFEKTYYIALLGNFIKI